MKRHHFKLYNYAVALFLSATVVVSCNENVETVAVDEHQLPSMEVLDLDVNYTEYGKTKVLLKAPLLQRFLFGEEPYSLFPKGFHVQFFADSTVLESQITADFALYKEKPVELWMAAGNVVVMNFLKKQHLYTDTLYWNRAEHIIYTNVNTPVRVETEDGIIDGHGMNADETFTTYELRNVGEGSVYYFDDTPGDSTVSTTTTVDKPVQPAQEATPRQPVPAKTIDKPVLIRREKVKSRSLMVDTLRPRELMDATIERVR